MSKECLITRLKAVVDNPALEYFDALQFRADLSALDGDILLFNGPSNYIRFGGPGVEIVCLSNCEVRTANTTPGSGVSRYTIPATDWQSEGSKVLGAIDSSQLIEFLLIGLDKITHLDLNYPNTTYIELRNPTLLKYCINLSAFERSSEVEIPVFRPYPENDGCDISDYYAGFKDRESVTSIRFYNRLTGNSGGALTGSHGFIEYPSLKVINRNAAVDYGRLIDFVGDISLTALGLGKTGSKRGVEGNITDIAALTSLSVINCNDTKVEGSLEEFAAAQYAAGRKSASRVHIFGRYITYQDDGETKYVGTAGVYLSWTDGGSAPVVSVSLT